MGTDGHLIILSAPLKPVIFVAIFLLAMVGQEWALRFALPDYNPAAHIRFIEGKNDRPTLGEANSKNRQIKNTGDYNVGINFNRHGLRDVKDVAIGTAQDIYLVGDSYSFGWGVEENQTAATVLQGKINRPVFNVSIPGDINEYELLLDYAGKLGAEVRRVILFITMENDLHDYSQQKPPAPAAPPPTGRPVLAKIKEYLTAHSATYLSVTSWIQRTTWLQSAFVQLGLIAPNLDAARGHEISDIAIATSAERVRQLASRFDTLIVVAPARSLWWGSDDNKAAAHRIHKSFVDRLRTTGQRMIDLKPVFERSEKPLSLFFTDDPHWRPATHALIAGALADQLPETWR